MASQRTSEFFETHPVFTHAEYLASRMTRGRSRQTANNLLARYLATGRLIRIRRGLYATVPVGVDPTRASVDPYLVISRLTPDSIVAYHAALQFFGQAHSLWRRFHYLTRGRARPVRFRDLEFVPVQLPAAIRERRDLGGGITDARHMGSRLRVTTLERTLVDVMDAPDKGGGWEEIWRSLEAVEFFDLDLVVECALALDSSVTAARVGFFLEEHREALMAEDRHLEKLRARAPSEPRYLDAERRPGRLVSPWNLIVPKAVLDRQWEETA